ncbi:putative pectinesterase 29 [Acorus gramineus]|uniref:pectinesterase n=1 Tax=Acorus gramineus TaxID=55184 RepID=A0AAV9BKK6_ACOGR|nr:putative pectinesterase 29 [Acorus gramineus]
MTVQEAINAVPDNNNKWYRIIVKTGLYREKNTYNLGGTPEPITQAVAVLVGGDKAAFYNCAFESLQDTLCDFQGQHYFKDTYILGGVDFIFGSGQSVYERCDLHAIQGNWEGPGYVTAQGRESGTDENGFIFKWCNIYANNGTFYLGRAWRGFSRVVFYRSKFKANIVPQGWDAWDYTAEVSNLVYAEQECQGPGSDTAGRVAWERKLSRQERKYYINDFNHGSSWLPQQPS